MTLYRIFFKKVAQKNTPTRIIEKQNKIQWDRHPPPRSDRGNIIAGKSFTVIGTSFISIWIRRSQRKCRILDPAGGFHVVSSKAKRIAVIDDSETTRAFMGVILSEAGYSVLTANDGREGLNLIEQAKPDLIILDLVMPNLSGFAVLNILQAKGITTPVLVITGIAEISDDLAHLGIAGLIVKPIDADRLLRHIDAIFKLQEVSEEMETNVEDIWESQERSIDEESWPEPLAHVEGKPLHHSGSMIRPNQKPSADSSKIETESPPASLPPDVASPPPIEPEEVDPNKPKPLVLIVEDEEDLRSMLSQMLEFSGFRAATAADGQEGLNKAQELTPNAIILDLMLPKLDGFQVCRLLKFDEKYREIPIIILTARSQPEDQRLAEASGADAYMTKPFETDVLLETLHRVIVNRAHAHH